ncbi:MAG: hypothetical protein U5K43_13590 [Halofilum sp. (in: g-proteobacteria)]|nr:hypothetical protein [Halofilum sp. (in: g-proteobacteria)]
MRDRAVLPLRLKLAFTGFMLAWVPLVLARHGWQNFLWLCDLGNFLVLAGLWLESRLLLSSQLVATLLIGVAWAPTCWSPPSPASIRSRRRPTCSTRSSRSPCAWRRCSTLFVPGLLLFAVARLGHDRRGWLLQTLLCWIVLPLGAWLTDPARNINWVEAPFAVPQTWLPPWLYLVVCMAAYPLLLYAPVEALLRRALPAGPERANGV